MQGGGVERGGFGAGVNVEFAGAFGEIFQKARHRFRGHAAGVAQAEEVVGEADAVGGELRQGGPAEAGEDPREEGGRAGFADEAGLAEAELGGDG